VARLGALPMAAIALASAALAALASEEGRAMLWAAQAAGSADPAAGLAPAPEDQASAEFGMLAVAGQLAQGPGVSDLPKFREWQGETARAWTSQARRSAGFPAAASYAVRMSLLGSSSEPIGWRPIAAELAPLAEQAAAEEPDNAFWPVVGSLAALELDRGEEAAALLARAAALARWDEHLRGEVAMRQSLAESRGRGLSRSEENLAAASVPLPHLGRLGAWAEQMAARGPDERNQVGRIGLLMAAGSESRVGAWIGHQLAAEAAPSDEALQAAIRQAAPQVEGAWRVRSASPDPARELELSRLGLAAGIAAALAGAAVCLAALWASRLNAFPAWGRASSALALLPAAAGGLQDSWPAAAVLAGISLAACLAWPRAGLWTRILCGGAALAVGLLTLGSLIHPLLTGEMRQVIVDGQDARLIYGLSSVLFGGLWAVWLALSADSRLKPARLGVQSALLALGAAMTGLLPAMALSRSGLPLGLLVPALCLSLVGLAALVPGDRRSWSFCGWGAVALPAAMLAGAVYTAQNNALRWDWQAEAAEMRGRQAGIAVPDPPSG